MAKSARRRARKGEGRTSGAAPRPRERGTGAPDPGPATTVLRWLATGTGFRVGALVLLLLGLAARTATWSWVFPGGPVELVPTDSHYYVRLALLHLSALRPVHFDPFVAFPFGAENYWPPLHTLFVTIAVAVATDPEAGAAFVGPVAFVLGLLAVAAVGRRTIGPRPALLCVLAVALTPIASVQGAIGNADHHVHEVTLVALSLLLLTAAIRGSNRAAVATGVVVGAARLFTPSGFVLSAVVAAGYVLACLVCPAPERRGVAGRTALTGAAAVATSALAVLAFGRPLALDYEALTAFHPLLTCALYAIAAGACALLAGDRGRALRYAPLGLAAVPLLPQLWRAAQHLGRGDPLLVVVRESQPLAADPLLALFLLGPVLLLLPFAFGGAVRALARRTNPELSAAVMGVAAFGAAAAQQARLATLLAGAGAVLLPLGLRALVQTLRRGPATAVYAVAALALSSLLGLLVPPGPRTAPSLGATIRPTLVWMRENLPPLETDPYDIREPPTYGVLAPFEYGHFITLYAERPALSTPFSQTAAHVRANRLAAEVLAQTDEEEAFALARELNLRFVVAAPAGGLLGIGAPGPEMLLPRLIRRQPLGRFQPLFVSEERRADGGRFATVYEIVEGAVMTGSAPPSSAASAALPDGYERSAVAGDTGEFRIRVSRPGTYRVSADDLTTYVEVTQAQVHAGNAVQVSFVRP